MAEAPEAADAERWHVTVGSEKNGYFPTLVVAGDDLRVEFISSHAWNTGRVWYRDERINRSTGATGAVFQWNGRAEGTGHGHEAVRKLTLRVDDETHVLMDGGPWEGSVGLRDGFRESVDKGTIDWRGERVDLIIDSSLGPFDKRLTFTFAPDEPGYRAVQELTVTEAWRDGAFTGYTYVFMQMMSEHFDRWLILDSAGESESGQIAADQDTHHAFGGRRFEALACYSEQAGAGVLYSFPKVYDLNHHLLYRAGKDCKFRASLTRREDLRVGETLVYEMRLVPLEGADDWQAAARAAHEAAWASE